jgi:hypothetical protein
LRHHGDGFAAILALDEVSQVAAAGLCNFRRRNIRPKRRFAEHASIDDEGLHALSFDAFPEERVFGALRVQRAEQRDDLVHGVPRLA